MKLTIKSAKGLEEVVNLEKDLQFNTSKGEQYIFSKGFTNYILNFKDDQKSVELTFNVDGKTVKVDLKGIVPFLQENTPDTTNPTAVIINKNISDKDLDSIFENNEFNGSEIIDRLEALISKPVELGNGVDNSNKLTLISDFQTLIEALDAAAAGGDANAGGNNSNGSTFNSIFSPLADSLNGIAESDVWENLSESISNIPVDTGNTIAATVVTPINVNVKLIGINTNVTEGGDATYKVTLTDDAGNPIIATQDTVITFTYTYITASGADISETVSVTIPAGSSEAPVIVSTIDDNLAEGTENFTIEINTVSNQAQFDSVTIDRTPVNTTITDETPPPSSDDQTAFVSIEGPVNVIEGDVTTPYTVTISQATVIPLEVFFTYSGVAVDGTDFTGVGSVIIPAGQTSVTFTIATIDDNIDEFAENFTITINPSSLGAVGGLEDVRVNPVKASVETTIIDNDVPTISVGKPGDVGTADITVPEGNDAVFAVEVSKAAIGSTLTLTLADGTALDADYFADPANGGKFQYSTDNGTTWVDVTGPIALSAGNTNLLVSTDTIDDLIDEANETFTLTGKLTSNGSDYSDTATATIIDNDIETTTVSVSEEGLVNGIKDTDGVVDTTDNAKVSGTINLNDINNANITLIAPTTNLMSNGQIIVWTGTGTKELVGKIGTTEVIKVNINDNGEYTVELLQAVTHPVNSIEDIVSLNIGVKAADGTFTSTGTLVVNIEDDMPTSCTVEREINIEKDVIIVKNLQAGFKDSVYLNGTNEVTNTNTDADNYIDKIEWGLQTSESSGQSGYSLVDSNDYTTSTGTLINTNGLFKVADFTHQNWILSSNSSILEKTTLTMKMDITINGKTVPVEFEALLNHTETPNSGDPIASRDIITLVDTDIIVNVLGQDYIFAIEGFKDSNGNYVKTIYTDEAANNTYGIFASVKPVEALPVVEGNVCGEAGADGLDKVEWGDLTSPYGTMTVDANGKYTFIVNQATKDNLAGGDSLSQTFTYSIIDKDGDKSSSTVTIKINGSDAPIINAIPTAIDETNTLAFGQASANLVVTLDVSGSMATKVKDSSGNYVPRFDIEIDSMIKTIQAYKVNGKTEVNLTLFGDGAKNIGWMSADAAINYLSKLTLTSSSIKYDGQSISGLSTGGTDYDSALKSTMSINFSGHDADSTVAYFLSDGAPNKNTSSTDSDSDQTIKNWKTFVNENIDTLNVVGVGSGASVNPLKIVQVQDGDKVIMAVDDSTLGNILLGTVTVSSSGDVFDNIFGGDGAIKIDSIVVDGTTYNASNYTATNIATINNWQGTLEFNFSTGKYTYTTDSSQFSTDSVKTFKVNASDVDGDVASFKVNIKVDVTPNESKDIISIDNDDTIDLTSVINSSNTNKTDIIDITNGKINTLKIDMSDVVDLVDADKELIIKGDLGDKVDLDTPSDWSNAGKTQLDGTNYKVFTGTGINSTIKLLIEDDIDVTPDI